MRRGDGIPWMERSTGDIRQRVRDFERVVNAFYPTVTDLRLHRLAPRGAAGGRRHALSPEVVPRAVRAARAATASFSISGRRRRDSDVTIPTHEAYELWADTYPPAAHNPLMRVEQGVVERLLGYLRARRALDVGSGSGRYLPVLDSTGAAAVVGIDFSLAMLRRGGASRRRVCADACRLPFARSAFDLINASLMVGDIADLSAWSREMARVLVRSRPSRVFRLPPVVGAAWLEPHVPHPRRRTARSAVQRPHD